MILVDNQTAWTSGIHGGHFPVSRCSSPFSASPHPGRLFLLDPGSWNITRPCVCHRARQVFFFHQVNSRSYLILTRIIAVISGHNSPESSTNQRNHLLCQRRTKTSTLQNASWIKIPSMPWSPTQSTSSCPAKAKLSTTNAWSEGIRLIRPICSTTTTKIVNDLCCARVSTPSDPSATSIHANKEHRSQANMRLSTYLSCSSWSSLAYYLHTAVIRSTSNETSSTVTCAPQDTCWQALLHLLWNTYQCKLPAFSPMYHNYNM